MTERHPKGLYVLFATEMWERFGFYTAAAIMTLYLQQGGFDWSKDHATSLWSNYLMFIYATPLIGGFVADRLLGYRRAVLLGGLFFIGGYTLLGLGSKSSFYIALGMLFIGNGFLKPNISTMVGNLYPAQSPLKDSAYSIFYMGINVGALLAPLIGESMIQLFAGSEIIEAAKVGKLTSDQAASLRLGYLAAFYAAAVGMTLGTIIFSVFYRDLAVTDQRHGPEVVLDPEAVAVSEDVPPAPKSPIDQVPEMTRIGALLVIYFIVIVFWMVFHQNGTTMTYWANENTDWKFSGVVSNAINPFWIVVLSVPLVKFWGWLRSKGMEPSTPTKMALGMLLTSLAFGIMFVAAKTGGDQTFVTVERAEAERAAKLAEAAKSPDKPAVEIPPVKADPTGKFAVDAKGQYMADQPRVSPLWLISAYMIISLAELMLSPMGLSLVSKVSPARMRGMMMGGWFVATAIGNKLTAIGLLWTVWYHSSFWLLCSLSALAMGIVLIILLRPLKKAMPGV